MKIKTKNLLVLNFAVLAIATAAPLGKLVSLPPIITIASRCTIALIAIGLFMVFKKISFKFDYQKDGKSFLICALLQGTHWVTYFYALQNAGVGLGTLALFTFPIFTTLLEPFILKTKFDPRHLLLGIIMALGVSILTPEFNTGNQIVVGILFGIVSAVFFAIRNILMKKHVKKYDSSLLMFYQNGLVAIFLLPTFFFIHFETSTYFNEFHYVLFLGLITTAFGHSLFVKSFKNFSATTAALLSSVQPVYGIILGLLINEIPNANTIIGGAIILTAVVLETMIAAKKNKHS